MIGEGRLEALRRGVPGALYISVLVAVLWAGAGGAALAQFPDNRDLKLDPEDSVPPFYRGTLDERDRQRFDAAPRGRRDLPADIPGAVHGAGGCRDACAGAAAARVRGIPEAG